MSNVKDLIHANIGDMLLEISSGFACSKQFQVAPENGIPHLRPNNIGYWGNIDLSRIVYIAKEKNEKSKFGLKKGDILFNNTNSKELVGRAIHIDEPLACAFSNHITRLRVNTTAMNPKWLVWFLYKLWLEEYFLHICKKWIGQAGVDGKMLRRIPAAYPRDVKEQKRIADKIDRLFNEIDKGIEKTKIALSNTKELLKSELREAFSNHNFRLFKLQELLFINWGNTSITKKQYVNSGYPAYSAKGQDGVLKTYENECEAIILSAIGARCGKCFLADGKWTAIKNTIVMKVKDSSLVNHRFLYYYLNDENKWKSKGAGQPFISQEKANNLFVPLPVKNNQPDMEEQKRIVKRIDRIQELSKRLEQKYQEQLDDFNKLKQSILNQAFRGKL